MEENSKGYAPEEFDDDEYSQRPDTNKAMRGYRVVIIILSVILVALSALYYSIHRQQKIDNELLRGDRDSIQSDLSNLMDDYDNLKISNDTITANLNFERSRADSLMDRMKKERSWNLSKIREYQTQVKMLRSIAAGYVRQIDSLNSLNKKLISENITFRKEISTAKMRADMAEEKASELNNKVRAGSVIKARDIRLTPLNERSKEVTRVKNAARLRTDFVMTANELSTPGNRTVYVRIMSPDGYVLTTESQPTFAYEGERLTYTASRDVDYQNQDLGVGIYYNSSGFTAGTYKVQVYCDGYLLGSSEIVLR